MVNTRTEYVYTRADLEELTGMTKAGISQNIARGNLIPDDLVSVAAFLARYGTEDVRMSILKRMMGIDRQAIERARPQSSKGVGRDAMGRVAKPKSVYRSAETTKKKPAQEAEE